MIGDGIFTMIEQKIIITIEYQHGSGGERIGKLLAEKLNISFFDSEILDEASKKYNIEEKVIRSFDETFVYEGIYSLVQDVRVAKTGMGEYRQSLAEQVYLAEFNAIRNLAKNQSGVFIGRCSDYVLREYANTVHFFIHAPIDVRVERICRYENLERSEAEIIVRKRDREREKYYNFHADQKWGDARNYNLSIDTGIIKLDEAVSLLEQYIKSIGKAV